MTHRHSFSFFAIAGAGLLALFAPGAAASRELKTIELNYEGDDVTLSYYLELPEDFDPAIAHPVLLALPPGDQSKQIAEWALDKYWSEEASERGWIVVSPIAAMETVYHLGGEVLIPTLLNELGRTYRVESGRFHLAGVDRGGASAFKIATQTPRWFLSVLSLSGRPHNTQALVSVRDDVKVPIRMYYGELDVVWRDRVQQTAHELTQGKLKIEVIESPDDHHWLNGLEPGELFDFLDRQRRKHRDQTVDEEAISAQLTALHALAASGDADAYFRLYSPESVFLGTDPTERWTLPAFRLFAEPYFEDGSAWEYSCSLRNITVSSSGETAWFDEVLENERLGGCRGTGVLVKKGGVWLVSQYNLSIPIPNDETDKAVGVIEGYRVQSGPEDIDKLNGIPSKKNLSQ